MITKVKPSGWALSVLPKWNQPSVPKLGDFATYYGVQVADIGEDGDMVALGHVGKLRALAAFNAHARDQWGFVNIFDDRSVRHAAALLVTRIEHMWMTNDRPLDDWWMRPAASEHVHGAFPVTYWSA